MSAHHKSSSIFRALAPYYDLIYHRKNYLQESKYIDIIAKRYIHQNTPSILDIGCGTGEHLIAFIHRGYKGNGVDISRSMLHVAQQKISREKLSASLTLGDARSFSLNKTFSLIVSLFHVLSYQTSNEDVLAFFTQAARHMKKNSVFIFDCWYGPGVLSDPPKQTKQFYTAPGVTITRIKTPKMSTHTNTVTVTHAYSILSAQKPTLKFTERHTVRYFFFPEISFFLEKAGLKIIEWGTLGNHLSVPKTTAWEVYFVVKKT